MAGYLADPDPLIHFAAIQWVGEQRLDEFRPQLLAVLASSAATRNLFEATLAALERLDDKVRGPRDEVAGEEFIAALLRDPKTPPAVLERGLRMLRSDHPVLTLDRLRRFMTGKSEAVAIEAVRALGQSSLPGLCGLDQPGGGPKAPVPLRAEAIAGMADDAASRRQVLLSLATATWPRCARSRCATCEGSRSPPRNRRQCERQRGDIASLELLESLGGAASVVRPPVADVDAWLARLEGPAEPAAGERVFFHPKGPGCFRCHQVNGRGGRAGPDLSTLAAGMDRRRLVESILTPSKEIAPQFVAWSVARTDGTVFTGVVLEQTPEGRSSLPTRKAGRSRSRPTRSPNENRRRRRSCPTTWHR